MFIGIRPPYIFYMPRKKNTTQMRILIINPKVLKINTSINIAEFLIKNRTVKKLLTARPFLGVYMKSLSILFKKSFAQFPRLY